MQSIEESLKNNIEHSNTENINWTLTIVNKCLTLNNAYPSPKMSDLALKLSYR